MIRYIHPVSPRAATGVVATVYDEVRREFGALVEPFTLHSPVPGLLAGVWRACRAALVTGTVARDVKEAVAAAVSRANRCPYCVDAHAVMLEGTGAHAAARAIVDGHDETIDDARLRRAIAWAAASRTPGHPALAAPPFAPHERPEMVGTALLFHYINRPVTVLLGASPLPAAPARFRGPLRRAAGWWFGRAIGREKPVDLPPLLPAAPLPDDLRWANASPAVGDALARVVAVIEAEGARILPEDVRACVTARLEKWKGEDPGLGRQWLEPAVAALAAEHRPAARLALLSALAPYQVDDETVAAFRAHASTDAALVAALAWASFTAARRVGRWLVPIDAASAS